MSAWLHPASDDLVDEAAHPPAALATLVGVELAAYLGTVTALVTLAIGAMWVVASVLGRRIDDMGSGLGARIDDMGARIDVMGAALGARIDDMGAALGARMDRLEAQNDAIVGAVGDLGQRVAHLEARNS